ncbi:GNAT family N-acetyltransferase [Listeria sp. PSOL-1]|uniref:GNAT family N-acetyltransferase n=1 Tax=Listeria sp. PSOL-1 TaxID=1844999 RepID=UPI0013D43528|nr:GNAT family N-acetyltransferase [Listeria sp. PSOL-1]
MTVQKAITSEIRKDALKIRRNVFIEEQGIDPELEWDEFDNVNSATMFVDYANDGTAIATGRFRMTDGYGKVERICTLKAARGLGAGRRIMEAIEHEARLQGILKLKLGAQVTAIPFYEKLGYQIASELFDDAGIPHRLMEKTLK